MAFEEGTITAGNVNPTKEMPWDPRFWIALDLDGTLAKIISLRPPYPIGPIIPAMKDRLDQWLSEGKTVKIFTARIGFPDDSPHLPTPECGQRHQLKMVYEWLYDNGYETLNVVCRLDPFCVEMWNDRAVQVMRNQGIVAARQQVLFGDAPESFEQGSIFMEVVQKAAQLAKTTRFVHYEPKNYLNFLYNKLHELWQQIDYPESQSPLRYRQLLVTLAAYCFEAIEQYDRDMLPIHMDKPGLQPIRNKE